jgi:hypothetical protein
MGFANRATLAAGIGFAVAALAGCGSGGGLLSRSEADQLDTQLSNASSALSAGNCKGAEVALENFTSSVEGLVSINATLLSNLDAGARKILTLTLAECGKQAVRHTTTTQTTTTDTNTTPTVTVPATTATQTITTATVTTPTYTAPAVTTPATTTPTTPAVVTTPATTTPATTTPATTTPATTTPGPSSGGQGLLGASSGSGNSQTG